jgi:hypothetical protein
VAAYGKTACAAAILRSMTVNGYSRAACERNRRRFKDEYCDDPIREMAWRLYEEQEWYDRVFLPCLDPVEEAEMEGWSPRTTVENLTYRTARSIWADDCHQDYLANLEDLEAASVSTRAGDPAGKASNDAFPASGKESGVEAF